MSDVRTELDELDVANFEKRPFVPLRSLEQLFTRDKVAALMEENGVEFHLWKEATNAVLNNGIRLFAVLASIGRINCIARFLATDSFSGAQLDSKLPMSESDLLNVLRDPGTSKKFFEKQWRFLAPVFNEDQSHRELEDWTILPFTTQKPIAQGGFAVVYKVTVHASHHRLGVLNGELDLVCKRLTTDGKASNKIDLDQEVQILSSLRCLNHPNIIRMITSFTKGDEYNLLLPIADGDLSDLLLSSESNLYFPSCDAMLASLWGLSSALESIHVYFADEYNVRKIGCHYDIKPANILCMSGRLILSDFGLSRLRPEEECSRSLFKRGEGSYMAPECEPSDKDFKPGPIGRSSDVWSLGCVLSEVLVYLGAEPGDCHNAVKSFRNARRIKLGASISRVFHDASGVNPKVTAMLDTCINSPLAVSKLTSLALLISDILQFDSNTRPKASTVTRRLFHLAQQTLFEKILSIFESCHFAADISLEVEYARLEIWGGTIGLKSRPHDIISSAWLVSPHTYYDYEFTQDILQQYFKEIQHIQVQLDKGSRSHKLSSQLQRLQDRLWDLQPSNVRQDMMNRLEESMLNSEEISTLLRAGYTLSRDADDNSNVTMQNYDCYRRVAYLAAMREVSNALGQQTSSNRDFSINQASLGSLTTSVHNHLLKTESESGQRVLVEIIQYKDSWNLHAPELIERINGIVSLLSRDRVEENKFAVLKCKGYYHDIPRTEFGLVYQLPSLAENTDPMTLAQIIAKTQSRTSQPSLTRKFELASSLVSYVLNFHLGGWVHKSISSLNIICFPEVFNSLAASLSSPYFTGFNHCRLNNESAFTVSSDADLEYQHPIYLAGTNKSLNDPENGASRFRQEFDYYSVGLVLMEIAIWKPLKDITKRISGSPEELLEELLRAYIQLVGTYMGDSYANAVRSCLTSADGMDKSPEAARSDFRANVVNPIKEHSV